jgi:hypothetical protein
MTSKRDPTAWRVIVGTARGATHDVRGMPNQDSAETQAVAPAGGTVVAVADGHGHGRHFRSATGSRLAVATACAVVDGLTAEIGEQPWSAEVATALRDQLPQAIVARWRDAVAEHLVAHPYTPAELSALDVAGDGPEIPYGSTLLVALIAEDWLVCAQIGDGDLLAVRPDGGAWSPVEGDDLLDGYRTTSLCQPEAVTAFRAAAHDLRSKPLLALLLGTDGYGNAQVKDSWQPDVALDLAELAVRHDHGWFAQQIPIWAERCASAQGSGDDTTIALLLASDSARLAAAARPVTEPDLAPVPPAGPYLPPAGPTVLPAGPTVLPAGPTVPSPFPPLAPPVPPAGPLAPVTDPAGRAPFAPRHAAPASPRFSRRVAIAAIAAVVAAGAIAAALVLSQSSGASHQPQPTGRPVPKAASSPSHTGIGPVKPRASATIPVTAPTPTNTAGTPVRATTAAATTKNHKG